MLECYCLSAGNCLPMDTAQDSRKTRLFMNIALKISGFVYENLPDILTLKFARHICQSVALVTTNECQIITYYSSVALRIELRIFISTNKCTVRFYILCNLLLIFSYMFRRNRHLPGAYSNSCKLPEDCKYPETCSSK